MSTVLSVDASRGILKPGCVQTQNPKLFAVPDGLVSYWDFAADGVLSSTVVYDLSRHGNNLTLINSPTFGSEAAWRALNFDGVSNYATAPSSIFTANSPFSISFWMRLNSFTTHTVSGGATVNEMYPFAVPNSQGNDAIAVYMSSSQTMAFAVGSFDRSATTTSSLAVNAANHFVGTYDGTKICAYFNGQLEGQTAENRGYTLHASDQLCYIGRRHPEQEYNAYYNGRQFDFRIYPNRALAPWEVIALYQAGLSGRRDAGYGMVADADLPIWGRPRGRPPFQRLVA